MKSKRDILVLAGVRPLEKKGWGTGGVGGGSINILVSIIQKALS